MMLFSAVKRRISISCEFKKIFDNLIHLCVTSLFIRKVINLKNKSFYFLFFLFFFFAQACLLCNSN